MFHPNSPCDALPKGPGCVASLAEELCLTAAVAQLLCLTSAVAQLLCLTSAVAQLLCLTTKVVQAREDRSAAAASRLAHEHRMLQLTRHSDVLGSFGLRQGHEWRSLLLQARNLYAYLCTGIALAPAFSD